MAFIAAENDRTRQLRTIEAINSYVLAPCLRSFVPRYTTMSGHVGPRRGVPRFAPRFHVLRQLLFYIFPTAPTPEDDLEGGA